MVKPFYQGKLDTFCAIYAVLNALRLTHGIRVLKARDILNETLLALAGAPEAFRAVLDQETDYLNLVDGMLRAQSRAFPLEVRRPFAPEEQPTVDELWRGLPGMARAGARPRGHFPLSAQPDPGGPAGEPPLDHRRPHER